MVLFNHEKIQFRNMVAGSADKTACLPYMENGSDSLGFYTVGGFCRGIYRLLLAVFSVRCSARSGGGFYMGRSAVRFV